MATEVDARLRSDFGVPLVLIVIDTIISAAGYEKIGEENDAAAGQRVMTTIANLAKRTHTFVFGVDHFGKSVETGTRGSSAKEASADVVLAVLGDKKVTGEISNMRLALRKRRTGENGAEYAFRRRIVDLGVDESGSAVTSLVIEWMPGVTPKSERDPWTATRAVQCLRKAMTSAFQKGAVDFIPAGEATPVRAVPLKLLREEFKNAYVPSSDEDPTKRRKALEAGLRRALQGASDHGLIKIEATEEDEIVWEIEQPL